MSRCTYTIIFFYKKQYFKTKTDILLFLAKITKNTIKRQTLTEIFIVIKIKVDLIINICFMEKEAEKTEKKSEKREDRQIWLSVSEAAKLGGVDNKTIR